MPIFSFILDSCLFSLCTASHLVIVSKLACCYIVITLLTCPPLSLQEKERNTQSLLTVFQITCKLTATSSHPQFILRISSELLYSKNNTFSILSFTTYPSVNIYVFPYNSPFLLPRFLLPPETTSLDFNKNILLRKINPLTQTCQNVPAKSSIHPSVIEESPHINIPTCKLYFLYDVLELSTEPLFLKTCVVQ